MRQEGSGEGQRVFRLLYDRADFESCEEAKESFQSRWREDNPAAARQLDPSADSQVEELYAGGGAHYRHGRWRLIRKLDIHDYTKFSVGDPSPHDERNLLATCPVCRQTAYVNPLSSPSGNAYVHLASDQDGMLVDLTRHVPLNEDLNTTCETECY